MFLCTDLIGRLISKLFVIVITLLIMYLAYLLTITRMKNVLSFKSS
jgi:hypothetical protein